MQNPELLLKLKEGDERAFKDLISHHEKMVYNIAFNIVQQAEDADDITQEVFIQVYHSIINFKEDASISTWLYRVAVNKALDYRKKQMRRKRTEGLQRFFGISTVDENIPAEFHHPGVVIEKKEQAAMLFKALKKIPVKQQVAFTLHKIDDLSYKEVAEILEVSIAAVESLMGRAKKNLRKVLTSYYANNL